MGNLGKTPQGCLIEQFGKKKSKNERMVIIKKEKEKNKVHNLLLLDI